MSSRYYQIFSFHEYKDIPLMIPSITTSAARFGSPTVSVLRSNSFNNDVRETVVYRDVCVQILSYATESGIIPLTQDSARVSPDTNYLPITIKHRNEVVLSVAPVLDWTFNLIYYYLYMNVTLALYTNVSVHKSHTPLLYVESQSVISVW